MEHRGEEYQIGQLLVEQVPWTQLEHVWPQIEPAVVRGLRHGAGDSTSADEIFGAIANGSMLLWVVHDGSDIIAAIVLQVVKRESGLALVVVLVAGRDFWKWADRVQQLILEYAELIGAYTIEAVARDGMAKWLRQLGWRKKATIMELDHGRQK